MRYLLVTSFKYSTRICNWSILRRCIANEGSGMQAAFNSKILRSLDERGFLHQCSDFASLDSILDRDIVHGYLGFDATAKSLHIGSLIQILMLRKFQQNGHKPIVLLGGGTSKIGDPSGKDQTRRILSSDEVKCNIDSIARVFGKYLNFGNGPTDAILVNNADWLDSLNYLDFLRAYGHLFTVNRMLSYESVKQRLAREQPLTFLEFNYMIFQSYDFLELHRRYGVRLQLGGSDQWGNIISGIELARKTSGVSLFGLTTPLLTTSDGKKMGKSEAFGTVWLDRELTPEYDFWQYWRNVADADVIRFLKLFTEIPMAQIAQYEHRQRSELNALKVLLADEVTKMLHGAECLPAIHSTANALFAARSNNIQSMDSLSLIAVSVSDEGSIAIPELLARSNVLKSKSEARRMIKAGGVYINGNKIEDEHFTVRLGDFGEENKFKLSVGKKQHALIHLVTTKTLK